MADAEPAGLPIAQVRKIIAGVAEDINVSKEATQAIATGGGIFVHYITAIAMELCGGKRKMRQTLQAEDIIAALKEAELEEFVTTIEEDVQAYRVGTSDQNKRARVGQAEPPAASNGADAGHVEAEAGSNSGEAQGERNVNVQDEVVEGAGGDLPSPGMGAPLAASPKESPIAPQSTEVGEQAGDAMQE